TWTEAGNVVTNGRLTGATDLQRVTEKIGAPNIQRIMTQREGAVAANVEQQATRLSGPALQGEARQQMIQDLANQSRRNSRECEQGAGQQYREQMATGAAEGGGDPATLLGPNFENWRDLAGSQAIRRAYTKAQGERSDFGLQPHQWIEVDPETNTATIT